MFRKATASQVQFILKSFFRKERLVSQAELTLQKTQHNLGIQGFQSHWNLPICPHAKFYYCISSELLFQLH